MLLPIVIVFFYLIEMLLFVFLVTVLFVKEGQMHPSWVLSLLHLLKVLLWLIRRGNLYFLREYCTLPSRHSQLCSCMSLLRGKHVLSKSAGHILCTWISDLKMLQTEYKNLPCVNKPLKIIWWFSCKCWCTRCTNVIHWIN